MEKYKYIFMEIKATNLLKNFDSLPGYGKEDVVESTHFSKVYDMSEYYGEKN